MNQPTLDDEQLREIRSLVEQMGYLPLGNKALRLLSELERGDQTAEVRQLRERIEQAGYLPMTRALELIDRVIKNRKRSPSEVVLYPPPGR